MTTACTSCGRRHGRGGRPRVYSDEAMLAALKRFGEKYGRAPYQKSEMGIGRFGVPSEMTYRERFGSMKRALALVGMVPNGEGGPQAKRPRLAPVVHAARVSADVTPRAASDLLPILRRQTTLREYWMARDKTLRAG